MSGRKYVEIPEAEYRSLKDARANYQSAVTRSNQAQARVQDLQRSLAGSIDINRRLQGQNSQLQEQLNRQKTQLAAAAAENSRNLQALNQIVASREAVRATATEYIQACNLQLADLQALYPHGLLEVADDISGVRHQLELARTDGNIQGAEGGALGVAQSAFATLSVATNKAFLSEMDYQRTLGTAQDLAAAIQQTLSTLGEVPFPDGTLKPVKVDCRYWSADSLSEVEKRATALCEGLEDIPSLSAMEQRLTELQGVYSELEEHIVTGLECFSKSIDRADRVEEIAASLEKILNATIVDAAFTGKSKKGPYEAVISNTLSGEEVCVTALDNGSLEINYFSQTGLADEIERRGNVIRNAITTALNDMNLSCTVTTAPGYEGTSSESTPEIRARIDAANRQHQA